MDKKTTALLLIVIAIVAGVGYHVYNKQKDSKDAVATSSQVVQQSKEGQTVTLGDQVVTKVGTVACLDTTTTSGQQTANCAVGIKLDDGTSYALNADDPSVTGSLQTGKRVQVTGTLGEQSSPQYDAVGIIQVQSIQ